jgi:PAS domain S-box-containing protein
MKLTALETVEDDSVKRKIGQQLEATLKEIGDLKAALDEHAIVAITDPRGKIVYVNDKFCAISKYPREELLGQDHRIINSGYHSKDFIRALWLTITHGQVWHGEIKNKAKDGTFYWVDTTIVPFLNEQGKPRQYVAIRADITERKLAEEALKVSVKEVIDLKTALDEHAIVAITDAQGKITFVNDKFCSISKYSREELLGQDHRVINSGFHPREFIRDLWTTIAQGKVWQGEIKNKAKDGSFYWVATTIVPFLNEDGKPRQYVAIRADITERKRAEDEIHQLNADLERRVLERTEELAVAKERAESANKAKDSFLASMSHELRTPLNGIIGFAEFLVDGKPGAVNPKQREYLEDVLNSGRHLLHLINDMLDLVKIQAGKLELNPEIFRLADAIQEVCAGVSPTAQTKRIPVGVEIAPELDAVTLDEPRFKQILYNLLSNAIKFTSDGGKVDILVVPDGPNQFRLTVRDTGIGIKPEDIKRLFTEFEQLETGSARRFGGTGLGLALTRKIVQLQGGIINVESEFGKGSAFSVVLPLVIKEAHR